METSPHIPTAPLHQRRKQYPVPSQSKLLGLVSNLAKSRQCMQTTTLTKRTCPYE